MQQFFIESIEDLQLSADQLHQCRKVLRMQEGDSIRLVDHMGNGVIATFLDDALTQLKVQESIVWAKKKYKLRIVASLIRSERLEWMIQKACECGVDEIVLYQSQHGVVRDFGKRSERKMERLNLIAKEASEQSYRQYEVPVLGIATLNELPQYQSDLNLYADIGNQPHLIHVVDEATPSITVLVGPEGGFSNDERVKFEAMGYRQVSLGDNVLRAETASIYICNIVSACEVIK
ncbi:16S rRNA (uracil(1498)-N(3))-methyltransferase [Erysipelothrix piscisicarius]|uniref:Ribosomal RNA small subunit methyltransferase E n=1 Tax=Erysipelothrix piscisicarius TaxID=2485784 RepID=A0A3Q8S2T3_9FIRM|nr:RsmE family RNA methyltransferase [Erysipelothrix piscisicarius]AZK44226.1 16S rRNA (uracil(1498)-N(3))-methyltransferase [Erysipelothrix piscisicarius]